MLELLYSMHSIIAVSHNLMESGKSLRLRKLLISGSLNTTPLAIVELIQEPAFTSMEENRVYKYLLLLIGNMKQNELRLQGRLHHVGQVGHGPTN